MRPEALLVGAVEVFVVGHDHVGVARYAQVLAAHAFRLEHGHLFDQHAGVHHHAIADDRHRVLVHDARRHEVQRQLLLAMDDRVACVVAALEAHDVVVVARDEVGYLALAFVAPLGAHQHCGWHSGSLL